MASKMLKLKAVAQEQQHRGAGKEEEEKESELKLHTFNQAGIAVDDGTVSWTEVGRVPAQHVERRAPEKLIIQVNAAKTCAHLVGKFSTALKQATEWEGDGG